MGPEQTGRPELAPMVGHPALAHLHRNWQLSRALDPARRRAPFTGARSAAKAALGRLAYVVLRLYLAEEQELWANAVRLMDGLARRCDDVVEDYRRELDSLRADLMDLQARLMARLPADSTPHGGQQGPAGVSGPARASGLAGPEPGLDGPEPGLDG